MVSDSSNSNSHSHGNSNHDSNNDNILEYLIISDNEREAICKKKDKNKY